MGTLIFSILLWPGQAAVPSATFERVREQLRRLSIAGAAVAIVGSIGFLLLASATAETTLSTMILGSRIGLLLSARILLIGALLAVLLTGTAYRDQLAFALGLGALLTLSMHSHSAVSQVDASGEVNSLATALAVGFDFVHLLATSAWIGSLPALLLAALALGSLDSERQSGAATLLIAGYTGLATASLIALAATGIFAAFQHIDSVRDLWTTIYGRALTIKLGLFGLLLLLGAYNRWYVQPRLARAVNTAATHLRRLRASVAAEIALGAILLVAVAVLTSAAPPSGLEQQSDTFADTVVLGPVTLSLQVVRGNLAGDIFAVTPRGLPDGVQPEVVVRASMPDHGMGEQELKLQEVESGRWGGRASLLTMPGQWNVEAIVRSSGMNDIRQTFVVDTSPTGNNRDNAPRQPVWALLLVLAALAAALSQIPLRRTVQRRFQFGGVGILLVALVAAIGPNYLARAGEPTNPFTATPEVLTAGEVIYQRNCVSCHGTSGRGDGPAAASLPGLPADFTSAHFATHGDAELYGWIKGGKPGTAMPAFGDSLSEEQIWQSITYIRQLYAEANR